MFKIIRPFLLVDLFTSQLLCAGDVTGPQGACKGDSGGPLFVLENRNLILSGIVSYGLTCGSNE